MAIEVASLKATLGLDTSEFDTKSQQVGGKMGGLGGRIKSGLGGAAVLGAGMAVAAIAGIGVAAWNMAGDVEGASRRMKEELGLTADEADAMTDKARAIYTDGFGDSLDDTTTALIETRKQLKGLNENELTDITKRAMHIGEAFDADLNQVLNSTNVLMEEMGLSAKESLDFITKGFQDGLNNGGDFLDSIGEYGNLFGDGQATAAQFFSTLETGLSGGVLGTDKIGDAFKEFQIRFAEGNEDLKEGLGTIGLDYDTLRAGIEDGSLTMMTVFGQVAEAAGEIGAESLEGREALGKLGTQFEDLSSKVAEVDIGATKLDEIIGSSDALLERQRNIGERWEIIKRKSLDSLTPIGEKLLEVGEAGMDWIDDFLVAAQPMMNEFKAAWDATLAVALPILEDSMSRINEAFGLSNEEMTLMDGALWALDKVLKSVVIGLKGVAIASQAFAWMAEKIGEAYGIAKDLWSQIKQIWDLLGSGDADWLGGLQGWASGIKDTWGGLQFAEGGVVPGAMGAPQLAMVHGGETIIPAGQSTSNTINITINGAGNANETRNGVLSALRAAGMA